MMYLGPFFMCTEIEAEKPIQKTICSLCSEEINTAFCPSCGGAAKNVEELKLSGVYVNPEEYNEDLYSAKIKVSQITKHFYAHAHIPNKNYGAKVECKEFYSTMIDEMFFKYKKDDMQKFKNRFGKHQKLLEKYYNNVCISYGLLFF